MTAVPSNDAPPAAPAAVSLPSVALAAISVWLFFFVLFKLLGFFMITVNLLVSVLLIGHPVGVWIASRKAGMPVARVLRGYVLVLLATVMAVALLQLLHPNYLAVFGFEQRAFWIGVGFVLVSGLVCLPYFISAGMVEYVLLEAARQQGRPLSLVYGLLLGTTLLGLIVGHLLLPVVGSVGLLGLSIALAVAAAFARGRLLALGTGLLCALVAATVPGVERGFIHAIAPAEPGRTGDLLAQPDAISTHAAWGKHAWVEMVQIGDTTFGSYNGLPYWDVPRQPGRQDPNFQPDALLMQLLPEGGRLGLIGAGGGRQVQTALAAGRNLRVDGFELEPEVGRFFATVGREANGGVYQASGVELLIGDGRTLVRTSEHQYDAVYLADPGNFFSHVRTMLMATHFLHTRDAYADYLSQLTDSGLIAALIMRPADKDRAVSQRIVNIMHDLGLESVVVESELFRMTIGTRAAYGDALRARVEALAPSYGLQVAELEPDLSLDNPIPTDDRGGSYIFSLYSLPVLERAFALIFTGALVLLLGVGLLAARSAGSTSTMLVAGGLGASFAVLQNAFILALARDLLELTDAVFFGSAMFLTASMAGALLTRRLAVRPGVLPVLLVGASALTWLLLERQGGTSTTLLAALAVIVVAGALFPMVLDTCDRRSLPVVFAIDGLGAMLGTLVVFFTPLLYGISTMIAVALVLCTAMAGIVALHVRRSQPGSAPR